MVGFVLDVLLRLLWVFINMISTSTTVIIAINYHYCIIIAIVTCGFTLPHCKEYDKNAFWGL